MARSQSPFLPRAAQPEADSTAIYRRLSASRRTCLGLAPGSAQCFLARGETNRIPNSGAMPHKEHLQKSRWQYRFPARESLGTRLSVGINAGCHLEVRKNAPARQKKN